MLCSTCLSCLRGNRCATGPCPSPLSALLGTHLPGVAPSRRCAWYADLPYYFGVAAETVPAFAISQLRSLSASHAYRDQSWSAASFQTLWTFFLSLLDASAGASVPLEVAAAALRVPVQVVPAGCALQAFVAAAALPEQAGSRRLTPTQAHVLAALRVQLALLPDLTVDAAFSCLLPPFCDGPLDCGNPAACEPLH